MHIERIVNAQVHLNKVSYKYLLNFACFNYFE
jgi:hypothetical protein